MQLPTAKRKRPGCGRFCQQAGGFGADDEVGPVEIPPQVLGGTRDGVVAISSTCNFDRDCVGAIILAHARLEFGRANFSVPAGETRLVRVGITRRAKKWLVEHGDARNAFATVPLVYDDVPLSIGDHLRILAP